MLRHATALLLPLTLAACAGSQAGPDPVPSASPTQTTTRIDTEVGQVAFVATGERFDTSTEIDAPVDRVWAVLPAVYQELGVEYTTIESSSHRIGNSALLVRRQLGRTPLQRLLDCGTGQLGPNAASYQVAMSVFTQLAPAVGGGTTAVTNVEASARPVSLSGNPVTCGSTRLLEKQIATLVHVKLKTDAK